MPSNPAPALRTFIPDSAQPQDRFGVDVVTYPSLDPNFTLLKGMNCVAERVYRRFSTQRGSLTFHPDDGLDIRAMLSKGMTSRQLAAIKGAVEAEAKKDEQVDDATASVDFDEPTFTLTIQLSLKASDDTTFSLTLAVTALDVTLFHVAASTP